MRGANLNQRWARTIVARLCAGGVREAVVCPGSRSTPLALACVEQPSLRTWPVIDERTAGFFALGMAKHSGAPVILVATSGTAPAHFYPAVIEASLSGLPLVVLSADRPWELHGFGAPQTIDQEQLFGRHVRRFESLPVPDAVALPHLAAVVDRAVAAALSSPRGPIHFNVPFREPLAPVPDADADRALEDPPATSFAASPRLPQPMELEQVASRISEVAEGVIVCGPRDQVDGFADAIERLSKATGYPVLAEAASQVRSSSPFPGLVLRFDAILRNGAFAEAHRPRLVLRFGGGLASKRLQAWGDGSGAELIAISDEGELYDPSHRAARVLTGNAAAIATRLAELSRRGATSWLDRFAAAQTAAEGALDAALSDLPELSEPALAREVAAALPPNSTLYLSSSMPIRDVDGFAAATPGVRVLSNRGANGIDGVIASALGAAASAGRPTALLIGDLAFLHDLGALLIAARSKVPLSIVVANNDGGGIFSFLPIAGYPEHFEALFGTPHGLSFEHAAAQFGAGYARPSTRGELRSALTSSLVGGLSIVEVRTAARERNVELHDALGKRMAAAVGAGPWS